jgi:hypothetical protein
VVPRRPPPLSRAATAGRPAPSRGDRPAEGLSLGRFRSYLRLAEALETVPEAQREAAVPPSRQDWSLADSGRHLATAPLPWPACSSLAYNSCAASCANPNSPEGPEQS